MDDAARVAAHLRAQYQGVFDEDRISLHIADYVGLDVAAQQVQEVIARAGRGARVLDVGCGFGSFVLAAREAGLDAVGIEPAEYELDFARRRLREQRPGDDPAEVYVGGDALALPFADGCFDVVTLWNVIEHIPDTPRLLAECTRVLRDGGRLFAVAPNYASFRQEAHYHVAWAPLLPRALASRYLRLRGRDPSFFEQHIHYCTNWGVRRILRRLPVRVTTPAEHKVRHPEAAQSERARRVLSALSRARLSRAAAVVLALQARNPLKRSIRFEAVKDGG